MSEIGLLSLEQSPLFQSILQDSNYQDFIYSLQESIGALTKHRVEIPFEGDWKANTSSTFRLPRYGLVYNMYLRITIKNDSTGGDFFPATGYFANIFDRITLLSHSREIEQLGRLDMLENIQDQPQSVKRHLLRMVDYNPATIGNNEYRTIHIPLPFAFFQGSKWKSIKDLTFLEDLTLMASAGVGFKQSGPLTRKNPFTVPDAAGGNTSELTVSQGLSEANLQYNKATTAKNHDGTDGMKIITKNEAGVLAESCLVVDYLQIPNDQLRALQQASFKLEQ